jgi:hypothetical protein
MCLALLVASSAPAEAEPPGTSVRLGTVTRFDTVYAAANRPPILSVHPDLLTRLHVLADALHKEIVLCLHGDVIGDTVRLARFSMPHPHRSDMRSARFGPCPPDALATWHNHPVAPSGFRVPRAVTVGGTAGLCRLSETDARTAAMAGLPFALVSVDASTMCWWTLKDVRGLGRQGSSNRAFHQVY